jgi:hypothetical protein
LPSSFESDRRGNFPSPTGLPSTPRSPVSNINRIRPASPLQTGLVQPWVQSEGSCLASATPLNVSFLFCIQGFLCLLVVQTERSSFRLQE